MIIPALTLHQPWASLVAIGAKPYETRKRAAPLWMVGKRIAIHAAKRKVDIREVTPDMEVAFFAATGDDPFWYDNLPLGAVVCTARLSLCIAAEKVTPDQFGNYSPGRFAWRFTDVEQFASPCPARGQQRYGWPWTVPKGFVA
jgi:activating signal cointegrator 1